MLTDPYGFALLGLYVKSLEEKTDTQKRGEGNREREREHKAGVYLAFGFFIADFQA